MKKIGLILFFLLCAISLFAQGQFGSPNMRPQWFNEVKANFFWLSTSDTTGYAAGSYRGAVMYKASDSILYVSNGIRWEPVGSSVDLSNYYTKDSTNFLFLLKSDSTIKYGIHTVTVDSLIFLKNTQKLISGDYYKVINCTSKSIPVSILATSDKTLDTSNVSVIGYSYLTASYFLSSDKIFLTDLAFGVIRCTDGKWAFINVNGHLSSNLDTVGIVQAGYNKGRLYVSYEKQNYYTEVGSFLVDVDDSYAQYGISIGASVGNNLLYIDMFKNMSLQGEFYFDASSSKFLLADKALNMDDTPVIDSARFKGDSLTVYFTRFPRHTGKKLKEIAPIPLLSRADHKVFPVLSNYNDSTFSVKFYRNDGSLITNQSDSLKFFFRILNLSRTILGENDYKRFASQHGTNIWLQGYLRKEID